MAGPQRSYSFQIHDDDPDYNPLHGPPSRPAPPPDYNPLHGPPSRPAPPPDYNPLHGPPSRPAPPPDYNPLHGPASRPAPPPDDDDDHHHHHRYSLVSLPEDPPSLPRRVDSSSSSSSSGYTSRYSFTISPQPSVRRPPLPMASLNHDEIAQTPDSHNLAAHQSPVERGGTPAGAVRSDGRYWGPELGYDPVSGHPLSSHSNRDPFSTPTSNMDSPLPPSHDRDELGAGERRLSHNQAGYYTDNPYSRYSRQFDPVIVGGQIDGTTGDLDDDDDIQHSRAAPAAAAAGMGAGGSGAMLMAEGSVGKDGAGGEKSDWLASQTKSRKRVRWLVGIAFVVILCAIAGGVAAGVIVSRNKHSSSSSASKGSNANGGLTESEDLEQNGDLSKNSKEIKALMNNADLKKVFHGMDYTPLNAVYPECEKWPPTQNNITRDMAVMSQLTDRVRLYGTDCNQTEMVLHAIDRLDIDMKVWLGVWLDGNQTTNDRQLDHLYELMHDHKDRFAGVAVGNEVLFRKELSEAELTTIVDGVRKNLTDNDINIPVGTSDLGSNWTPTMAAKVDYVMANVHPFFAGIEVAKAADWTYTFFEDHDVSVTAGLSPKPKAMISEVGWPSQGGHLNSSVAGIDEMNQFMEDFICQENDRGTEYFWFSAFDEAWKKKYNEPKKGKEWEDHWGLMDVDRKLKDGLKIPDCKPKRKKMTKKT